MRCRFDDETAFQSDLIYNILSRRVVQVSRLSMGGVGRVAPIALVRKQFVSADRALCALVCDACKHNQ